MGENLTLKASLTGKKTAEVENGNHKATETCKKLFNSPLWHYPIHQFVGDIVRS